MSKQRILSMALVVCAANTARANDWTELGADSEGSRDSSEVSGPVFAPAWTYALNAGPIIATPLTSGGSVVIAGSQGTMAAVNASDGKVAWTQKGMSGGVLATPTISGERVIVPTWQGSLYALDLADGAVTWQRSFGGQNASSPLLLPGASRGDADTLVIGAGFPQQDVWRFNALTGEPLWQTAKGAIGDLVSSTAALAGSHVLVGITNGRLQSLDVATGATEWKYDYSGNVGRSSPLVRGARIYMFPGDAGAHLLGVDANTGAPLPGFPAAIPDLAPVAGTGMLGQGPAVSSPMAIGGLIIVQLRRNDMLPVASPRLPAPISMRETVAAIDAATGQVRWQYALASLVASNSNSVPQLGLCATPVGFSGQSGSFVAVSSSIMGKLVVLDAQSGQERWTTTLAAPGRSSPVFSNGQLLVATDDGVLRAFSSMTNRAPAPPTTVGPSGDQPVVAAGNDLTWQGASDPDGSPLSYIVRVQEDGAPLTREEAQTDVGQTHVTVTLKPATKYVFAVRSRDAQGALSAWSAAQRVQTGASMPTAAAVAMPSAVIGAPSGDVVVTSPSTPESAPAPAAPPSPASGQTPVAPAPPPGSASCAPAPVATPEPGAAPEEPANPAMAMAPSAAPTAAPSSDNQQPSSSTGVIPASQLVFGVMAHASAAPVQTTPATAAAPVDGELASRGGCSITAHGRTSTPASLLVLGLLALVARRRNPA